MTTVTRRVLAFVTAVLLISEAVSPCVLALSDTSSSDAQAVVEETKEPSEIFDETESDEHISQEIDPKEELIEPVEDNPEQEESETSITSFSNAEMSNSAVQAKTVANLVVFVRFKDDLTDEFNLIEYEYAKPKRSV